MANDLGYVRVAGYSESDLAKAYNAGKEDGKGDIWKNVSLISVGGSKQTGMGDSGDWFYTNGREGLKTLEINYPTCFFHNSIAKTKISGYNLIVSNPNNYTYCSVYHQGTVWDLQLAIHQVNYESVKSDTKAPKGYAQVLPKELGVLVFDNDTFFVPKGLTFIINFFADDSATNGNSYSFSIQAVQIIES